LQNNYLSTLCLSFMIGSSLVYASSFSDTDDAGDLGVITVTADRIGTFLGNTTANVSVITADEIRERGYRTLGEALKRVSGFSMASNGGPGQAGSLYLRGMKRGNVLILLDGVPLKDPNDTDFSYALEQIRLENVKQIEIVKGAQSGLWGSDAVAGVVNIITKSAANGGNVSLRAGAGSYATGTGGIDISAAGKSGNFIVTANHYKTGGFSALLPRNAEKDGYTNDTLDIKGRLNISRHSSVGIFYHRIESFFDYDSSNNPYDGSSGTFSGRLAGLDYKYEDTKLTLNALVSSNIVDRHYDDFWGAADYNGQTARATLTAGYRIDGNQRLSGGIEYNRYRGSSTWNPTSSYSNRAIYGIYRYIWNDLLGARTIFDAALRYDDFSSFKNKATYRLGVKRECGILPGFFSAANFYSAYKAPGVYEASSPLPGTTLKPEYTRGYEISAGYRKLFTMTFFHYRIEDEILYAGGWPPLYYNDGRRYAVNGLEMGGEWKSGSFPLTVSANYTRLFNLKDAGGRPLYKRSKNIFNLFLDYDYTPDITLGANLQYVGKRADQQWVGWTPTDVELDSYMIVNLSYNQQVAKHFSVSVQAHNIFNEKYENSAGYSTEGRSVYAEMEYSF